MGRPEDDFDLWSSEETRLEMHHEAVKHYAEQDPWPIFQESLQDGYDALDETTARLLWDAVIDEKPEAVNALMANLRTLFFNVAEQKCGRPTASRISTNNHGETK